MRLRNHGWMYVLLAIAMLTIPACSSSDNGMGGQPTAQAVQDGINDAWAKSGGVFALFELFPDPLISLPGPLPGGGGGGGCNQTLCETGSLTCQANGGPTYDFQRCFFNYDMDAYTLNGGLSISSPTPPTDLTLTGLTVDDSDPLSGTASLTESQCPIDVNVTTNGVTFDATICQAGPDMPPSADSQLTITIVTDSGTFVIVATFNGTDNITATATSNGSVVANCTIDLDTDIPAVCTAA